MAKEKVYIAGETKAQRKARKAREKTQKALATNPVPQSQPQKTVEEPKIQPQKTVTPTKTEYNVLCLKHGNKYDAKYVNILYSMVKRNLTLPFTFHCLTEDATNINSEINIIPLPKDLSGWWCKPYMYSNQLPIDGTILYIDLDVVISGSLDKLFTFNPGNWCVIRDFTRAMQPQWEKYNSSVVRFEKGQLHDVWHRFIQDPQQVIGSHFGDQDWLWTCAKGTATLFPDAWIRSYKWEIRKDRQLSAGTKGNRRFVHTENAKPNDDCSIAVFHGDPNPHQCDDPWVLNNWK